MLTTISRGKTLASLFPTLASLGRRHHQGHLGVVFSANSQAHNEAFAQQSLQGGRRFSDEYEVVSWCLGFSYPCKCVCANVPAKDRWWYHSCAALSLEKAKCASLHREKVFYLRNGKSTRARSHCADLHRARRIDAHYVNQTYTTCPNGPVFLFSLFLLLLLSNNEVDI